MPPAKQASLRAAAAQIMHHSSEMRLRLCLLPAALVLTGSASAQLLTQTQGSANSVVAQDSATYTPLTGSVVTVEDYYGMETGAPGASITSSHSFTGLVLPGAGGTVTGGEAADVIDHLTDGASSAVFTADLTAQGQLATSITGAGSDRDVNAAAGGVAHDLLSFQLTTATDLSLTGDSTFAGTSASAVQLDLTNLSTNTTTVITDDSTGQFSLDVTLGPGSYSLTGVANASAGFDYNAYQGTLLNNLGSFSEQLSYTADFAPPAPTPEPVTVWIGLGGLLIYIRAAQLRLRS